MTKDLTKGKITPQLIQVDESILTMSTEYLRIIFCGLIFTFLYNFYASTLRALGDSTAPLYFLMCSAALNIIGDLFFVIVLQWGSNGCALSTVISEALCCLFCGIYINVYSAGTYQWNTGLFPWHRRFKDYASLQLCQYGSTCSCRYGAGVSAEIGG